MDILNIGVISTQILRFQKKQHLQVTSLTWVIHNSKKAMALYNNNREVDVALLYNRLQMVTVINDVEFEFKDIQILKKPILSEDSL